MITREELIEIGIYNKPHGVNGEISATIDCELNVLSQFSCLVSEIDGIFVPFFVDSCRTKTTQTVLLQIDGINSEVDASLLVNKIIFVKKAEFDELAKNFETDEMPIDYFIGYKVVINKSLIGKIVDVDDSTANVLFKIECDNDNRILLIPAVEDFIEDIDTDTREMAIDAPDELLDL